MNVHAEAVYKYPPANGAQFPSLVTKPIIKKTAAAKAKVEEDTTPSGKAHSPPEPLAKTDVGRLFITLKQTEDEKADLDLFNRVAETISATPGGSKVTIIIDNGERLFRFE